MNENELLFEEFLLENEKRLDDLEHCTDDMLIQCYNLLNICAKNSCLVINQIDPSFRVRICQQLDTFLDIIVERLPFILEVEGNVFTPALQNYRSWKNVELMKDKTLTGYMLGEVIGANSHMFFCKRDEDYAFADNLPGLNLLKAETINEEAYYKYLFDNCADMDILILHGMYAETENYLKIYRTLRPDGKVYCALDMNSHWMEKVDWASEFVQTFMSLCNVVTTSSSYLRDLLNSNPNVNFPCRFVPNGFYNGTNIPVIADWSVKTNTILMVGRIGTKQKNNEEMLLGFAKIAHLIPSWNVKLVGGVETEFHSFLEEFFVSNKELKQRIILTGAINDKKDLYNEYATAKIFALTSMWEGGTPNVYAEALFHGCKFITSDIDSACDITNNDTLGCVYKLGDVDELATKLLEMCNDEELEKNKNHVELAVDYGNKIFSWEQNAKKIAYALFSE